VAACSLSLGTVPLGAQVRATHLYNLSNFSGTLPFSWTRVTVDQERDETYVVYGNLVRIFNASGMEVFSFGDDLELGQFVDIAVDDGGDVILLTYKDSRPLLTRCDYRGVPAGIIEIKNLPATLTLAPNRMVYRNGRFYLASLSSGSVVVADATGEFREHLDLLPMVADEDPKQKDGAEINGFNVDREGSIYFTVATHFKVYKLSPERKLSSFGRPGSAPGRFGVVAGIVTDSRGNVIVTDRLKCVVMVFDKDFGFLTEFGYRGARPENLIVPDDIAIDKRDRIYVAQSRKRGISVFALTSE
jgi:hypothetical protein